MLAVCAAFAAQPSRVPIQQQKTRRCADVRERCGMKKPRRFKENDGVARKKCTENGKSVIRLLSESAPRPDAVPTAPNMEDLYLYYFGR